MQALIEHPDSLILDRFFTGTLYITLATVFARIISATYSYILNDKIAFKSREEHGMAAGKYFLLALVPRYC